MRKISLLFVLSLSFVFTAQSQVDKGGYVIGGDLIFQTANRDFGNDVEQSQSNFGIDAQAGYFLIDNLAVGLHFFYQRSKTESNGVETTSSAINIGPRGTYYLPISDEFYIPLTLGVGYQTTTIDNPLQDPYDLTGYGVTIRVGGEYILDEWLGIRAIFGPQFGSYGNDDLDLDVNFFELEFGTGVFFYF